MQQPHKKTLPKKLPYALLVVTAAGIAIAVTSGEALLGIRAAGFLPNNVLWPMFAVSGVVAVVGGIRCLREINSIKNAAK